MTEISIEFDIRAIIALLALFVALWSIYSGRKHNRLSVKPVLCDSITSDTANFLCSFSISNKGLGPAVIKESSYLIDGKPVEFNEIMKMFKIQPSELVFRYRKIRPESVISKDEEFTVLEIHWDKLKFGIPDNLEIQKRIASDIKNYSIEISKRFSIKVTYESIYGESYIMESLAK